MGDLVILSNYGSLGGRNRQVVYMWFAYIKGKPLINIPFSNITTPYIESYNSHYKIPIYADSLLSV